MAALFGRFSRNSESLLIETQNLAQQLKRPVASDVVLLGLFSQPKTLAAMLLTNLGMSQEKLAAHLSIPAGFPEETPEKPIHDKEMALLLEEAIKLAGRFRFTSVEVEHLLFVIANVPELTGYTLLREAGIDPSAIASRISEWLFSVAMLNNNQGPAGERLADQEKESELEKFTFNNTAAAEAGELDSVEGRDEEIEAMIQILLRRRKNNPLLIGEPGVGKTAIIDALAQRIVKNAVPAALANKQVLTLDLGLVVAGTMYRGQFEERLKNIMAEVQQLGNAILFIDEIHTLSGTGSAEGGFDAANILKPALARGDITVIGATTQEEYRKHILKDRALDRRFQTVTIEEPSPEATVGILRSLRRNLEEHHAVMITDEAIEAAVSLSTRFIHDRFLPDKAIDLLDQASTLHAEAAPKNGEAALIEKINAIGARKAEAAMGSNFELAKKLMDKENALVKELEALQKQRRRKTVRKPVTDYHVRAVTARLTGIPLEHTDYKADIPPVGDIEKALKASIYGQDAAIKTISRALLRGQLGLSQPGKPLASFLLVGPTGVGKTETARILAKEIFKDEKALIKIDMSEYMERHNASNLIGAPAGYVGYDQGGGLTEQVRRRPYSVVLLDEVEKAHPDIFNILLQILEDGVLTDNTGQHISFAHTVIIMTSNIGMESFQQAARIGFTQEEKPENQAKQEQAELEDHIQQEIKDYFRPELLGRLSGIIHYKPLSPATVKKLFKRRVKHFQNLLALRSITVKVDEAALAWLNDRYEPEAGARSIDRVFMRDFEPPILDALAQDPSVRSLKVSAKGTRLTVKP